MDFVTKLNSERLLSGIGANRYRPIKSGVLLVTDFGPVLFIYWVWMKKLAHTELQLGMKVKSRKMSRLGQQAPLIDAEVVGLTPNLVCISAKFETQTINCILFRRENGNLVDDSNLEVAIYG